MTLTPNEFIYFIRKGGHERERGLFLDGCVSGISGDYVPRRIAVIKATFVNKAMAEILDFDSVTIPA